MNQNNGRLLAICAVGLTIVGCGGAGMQPVFTYAPIPGVPAAVNGLGHLIGQEQRDVVTPGGTVDNPGFSAVDENNFNSSNRLGQIVAQVTNSAAFTSGVAAIRTLPSATQQTVLTAYSTPIDPTWSETGVIGDGTTDAGEAVEQEIATALTNAVQAAVSPGDSKPATRS